jgi:excisionase family DNA binding protein
VTTTQTLLTDRQVAERFGVHWTTVKRWRLSGQIDFVYVGRQARLTEDAVAQFLLRDARHATR